VEGSLDSNSFGNLGTAEAVAVARTAHTPPAPALMGNSVA